MTNPHPEEQLPDIVLTDDHTPAQISAALQSLEEIAAHAEESSLSGQSRRLYASDWARFERWCAQMRLVAVPAAPQTVRLYAADMASLMDTDGAPLYKVATIDRHLAAIGYRHTSAGLASPVQAEPVKATMRGLRRLREETPRRMRPLLLADVTRMLADMDHRHWPAAVASARDAFVIVAGFAGAFRRSELAGLRRRDFTFSPLDGLLVRLGRTKTDQEGVGATVPLPFGGRPETCPVCLWLRWNVVATHMLADRRDLAMREIFTRPWPSAEHICRDSPRVLDQLDHASEDAWLNTPLVCSIRRDGTINPTAATGSALHEMVKRRAAAVGLHTDIGFHSLRAGFVTQARRNGMDPRAIRRQTRHGSDAMIEVYDREYAPLQGNAVTGLGL